jgi:hypothetical protein
MAGRISINYILLEAQPARYSPFLPLDKFRAKKDSSKNVEMFLPTPLESNKKWRESFTFKIPSF